MTTHSQRDWQTAIKRNVIILVALIVFVLSGSWGYLTWLNSRVETLENISENYHYAVYRDCSEIQLELRNIMFYLYPLESAANKESLPDFLETSGDLTNTFYIIAEKIRIIEELQKVFNNDIFEMLNYKVANLFVLLEAKQMIFEKRTYKITEELNNEFLELIKSLEQLKRLHKVEREKLEKKIVLLTKKNNIQLYSIIGGIILILSLITFNIFRSIRSIIDKQKTAELNLRKLSLAVEQSPNTIIITDINANIEYVNPMFTKITGYTSEDAIGRNPRILKSGKTPPEVYKKLWEIIKSGNEWRGEFINKKKNGELYTESTYIAPIKNTEGVIVHFVSVKEDITERKKTEEEIIKMQKLESVGILAGGIAHDFNNYLQGILSNIAIAKSYTDSNDKIYFNLNESEKAVIQAKNLTQQLLTFSKGGDPIKKAIFACELIKESASLALSGSNVRCELELPDCRCLVEVDKGQINQVFYNLFINANQAMPKGGVIKVIAEHYNVEKKDLLPLQEGGYIKITVKDQGIGISQEYLQKIFDPYFTTKVTGSGLGLATVFSIIKKHDGYIEAESEMGVGTTFYIYLPASLKEIPEETVESETDKKSIEKMPSLDGRRILFMEDDGIIRLSVARQLRGLKYEVEDAKDGNETIKLYKKAMESDKPFDAVIMDLTIPGSMGGKETIKKLLEIDPDVKAIIASGYSNDPIMTNFKENGFRGVVEKPFEIDELEKVLQKVIMEKGT